MDEQQLLPETVSSCPENTALRIWARTCLKVRCEKGVAMLYALALLVIAVIAGILGFGMAAAEIARVLFFVFLVLFCSESHLSLVSEASALTVGG
jgi:uncharacterized membrane protein YtjA (UPF0391 family)